MSRKKILIFGGTHFIGRVLVEELLEDPNGFDVTLFNRGITHAVLFPEVRTILGDRETADIEKVLGEHWDAIIDLSGYYPDSLEAFIPKLRGRVGRYVYVSTVSVYDHKQFPKDKNFLIKEDFPLLACSEEHRKGSWNEHYGEKKAECERILNANGWLDTIILRPSIVYGRYDYTERYYYWLERVKKYDQILIADEGKERGNLTFVDDLAKLLMASVTIKDHNGAYNAATHPVNTFKDKLDVITKAIGRSPEFVSIEADAIKQKGMVVSRMLPCNMGRDMLIHDTTKLTTAFDGELTPYADSVQDTISFYDRTTNWEQGSFGFRREQEEEILESL
jgi:2'-hydroxyisoflavone reductase